MKAKNARNESSPAAVATVLSAEIEQELTAKAEFAGRTIVRGAFDPSAAVGCTICKVRSTGEFVSVLVLKHENGATPLAVIPQGKLIDWCDPVDEKGEVMEQLPQPESDPESN